MTDTPTPPAEEAEKPNESMVTFSAADGVYKLARRRAFYKYTKRELAHHRACGVEARRDYYCGFEAGHSLRDTPTGIFLVICPDHGKQSRVDEDECCRTCGSNTIKVYTDGDVEMPANDALEESPDA